MNIQTHIEPMNRPISKRKALAMFDEYSFLLPNCETYLPIEYAQEFFGLTEDDMTELVGREPRYMKTWAGNKVLTEDGFLRLAVYFNMQQFGIDK